ncbi:Inhibin beta A chain, partial [Solea senegalensis]
QEVEKRHILNMIHLNARPKVTWPLPRAALLSAIQKLNVGHVTEDGRVEIQEEPKDISAPPGTPSEVSEVIVFAEPG